MPSDACMMALGAPDAALVDILGSAWLVPSADALGAVSDGGAVGHAERGRPSDPEPVGGQLDGLPPTTLFRVDLAPGQLRGHEGPATFAFDVVRLRKEDPVAAAAFTLTVTPRGPWERGVRGVLRPKPQLCGVEPVLDDPSIVGLVGLAEKVMQARRARPPADDVNWRR